MQISRRRVLTGASAAAAVTGLTVAPLAMKAAGVKAALAGTADPAIAAAGHWHKAFGQVLVQAEWWVSHQNPNLAELDRDPALAQEYEEHRETLRVAGQAVSELRDRLLARTPVTVAGAVALTLVSGGYLLWRRQAGKDNTPLV